MPVQLLLRNTVNRQLIDKPRGSHGNRSCRGVRSLMGGECCFHIHGGLSFSLVDGVGPFQVGEPQLCTMVSIIFSLIHLCYRLVTSLSALRSSATLVKLNKPLITTFPSTMMLLWTIACLVSIKVRMPAWAAKSADEYF